MNRIEKAFRNGTAFIPFITAGDPNLDVTEQLVVRMAASGADLIELGVPFSDPVAEGPVIQQANERALAAGVTTDGVFEMVKRVRKQTDIPLVFLTYVNPVYTYGTERFMRNCADSGVDGLIVPDLPYEEKDELLPFAKKHGIKLIALVAPTSQERIRMIAKEAEGFVYCVSSMGVTGVRSQIKTNLSAMIASVKAANDLPCAIGFGIASPEQAHEMGEIADGVIVGSAIVKIIEQYGEACVGPVGDYVAEMKQAAL
ncbi:tryptophan synthase subunit alpha [Candidatus Soleaferrea massiliensis]|uniref:tryptophan synthase subunit alpha n=1 Tax=Candidatus Soleaferrea massiliensis TaxID=1470354 RepID=UPI000590D81E|nr:tryptophan synthase subunit alpha [Candidatus Soleaferrea massiliensis]